jgi:hypothetical protein
MRFQKLMLHMATAEFRVELFHGLALWALTEADGSVLSQSVGWADIIKRNCYERRDGSTETEVEREGPPDVGLGD